MSIFEFQTKDGRTERVLILGSDEMSRSQLQELLEWSKQNSEKYNLERQQRARYKKIPAIQAYYEMKRFREWLAGKGRIF